MPASSTQKAWIIAGSLALLASLVAAGIYLHFARRVVRSQAIAPELSLNPPTPQQTQKSEGLLDQLPAGASAIAFLDVESQRKIPSSPLATLLGLVGVSPSSQDRDYRQFVGETGFDYTRDLDRAAIAWWPAQAGGDWQDLEDNRAFIVAEGRFDAKKIAAYALKRGRASAGGDRTIYEVAGKPPVAFEFRSATIIALASGTGSAELLLAPGSRLDPGLQARVELLGGAPLFAVARTDRLPSSFYDRFKNSPQLQTLARSVKTLDLAAQPQGGVLKLAVEGETSSSEDALAISTLLEISRMGASMALANPKNDSAVTHEQALVLQALLSQLRISRQGHSVRVRCDVTPAIWNAAAISAAH